MRPDQFRVHVWRWYRRNGRHDLPWRKTRDPYRILVSEVMLQQTQVSRVIRKYRQFIRRFPTVRALARAPIGEVLTAWHGLGYNRRAAHVKRLAEIVVADYDGKIPSDPRALRALPGIGAGTAGAVAVFAFNKPVAFLETNIRRVFLHHFFPRRRQVSDARVLSKIAATLPSRNIREWYWALMDYGAGALREIENPNRRSAQYARQAAFEGSNRQLRGRALGALVTSGGGSAGELLRRARIHAPLARLRAALEELAAEGLARKVGQQFALPGR